MSKHETFADYPQRGLAAAEAALLTIWPILISVENFSGKFNPSRLLVRSQIGCGNAGGQG